MARLPQSVAVSALCLALSAALDAQTFTYQNFTSLTGLSTVGSAAPANGALRVVPVNVAARAGACWTNAPVAVSRGFDTTFTFRLSRGVNTSPGPGFAFVVQADSLGPLTIGGIGSALGYGGGTGIHNSLAIEFDTTQDFGGGDLGNNDISIHTRGTFANSEQEQASVGSATAGPVMSDGAVHTARIRCQPDKIDVWLDDLVTPIVHADYALATGGTYLSGQTAPALAFDGVAHVGFTGAQDSFSTQDVDILSWTWNSVPLADPCFAGSNGGNVLRVEGSDGGALHSLPLQVTQQFTIRMDTPPGSPPGMPFTLLFTPQATPGAPGTRFTWGKMCFPIDPLGASVLVLADSFGVLPAPVPATTTPFSFTVPRNVVTFTSSFVLQAIVATGVSPLALATTNAIQLDFAPVRPPLVQTVVPASAQPGVQITLTGTGFVPGLDLTVNGLAVQPTRVTPTTITFPYPAGTPCGAALRVTNPDGQQFIATLNPQPVITTAPAVSGPAIGGGVFVILGTGFAPGTTATIGGVPANVTSAIATLIVGQAPPGAIGVVPLVLTTPGGCQVSTNYTYR